MTLLKRIEHGVKLAAFYLARPFFIRPAKWKLLPACEPKKILLLRPEGKIGDVVVSLPVLATLRKRFPHADIALMGSPRVSSIFACDDRLSRFIPYSKRPIDDLTTIIRLRRERFDYVIDLIVNDSVTTLILAHLVGRKSTIVGAGKSEFARYYDVHLPVPTEDGTHIITLTLNLVGPLGIANGSRIETAPLITSSDDTMRAEEFVRPLRVRMAGLLTGINLSAGSANRVWGKAKSDALVISYLETYPNDRVVLFAVGGEYAHAEQVVAAHRDRVVVIPKGSIRLAAAILERIDLLITPDTSLTHVARAHGCGVVSLMPRPRTPKHRWRPFGQEDGVVYSATGDYIHDIELPEVMDEISRVHFRISNGDSSRTKPPKAQRP